MPALPARVRPRFLAPDIDTGRSTQRLPQDEARHLTRVLRLAAGALVHIFDGCGHEFLAAVAEARGESVTVRILEAVEPAPESRVPFTLVQALLKGGAIDDIVRDATMMGAAAIQPVITTCTVSRPPAAFRPATLERWRRIAIASAKQSRRATIPDVRHPIPIEDAWAAPGGLPIVFVEPSAGRPTQSVRALATSPPPASARLFLGPEGGWDPLELDGAVSRGAALVTLGPLTLRADAVPIAAMAVFRMLWE